MLSKLGFASRAQIAVWACRKRAGGKRAELALKQFQDTSTRLFLKQTHVDLCTPPDTAVSLFRDPLRISPALSSQKSSYHAPH